MKKFVMMCAAFVSLASAVHGEARIVRPDPQVPRGELRLMRGGGETTLARDVRKFWELDDGNTILWSGMDGGGGYENEGQSLWRYDVKSGTRKKLVAETFRISDVHVAQARSGRRVFVLAMRDGGLGAPHIHIISEKGKSLWRHRVARLAAIRNGRIAVGILSTQDVENSRNIDTVKPRRMTYLDIDRLTGR